jgi:hypothetical protein
VTRFTPSDLGEFRNVIGGALVAEEPLELLAGATKRELGRPLQLPHTLDLSRITESQLPTERAHPNCRRLHPAGRDRGHARAGPTNARFRTTELG